MPLIRDFQPADAAQVDALGLSAFEQFKDAYQDWPAFQARIATMSALADVGEIIVAEVDGALIGAVAYLGPGAQKATFFRPEWPIMRMLVVAPKARGHGAGRALAMECLRRARRDGASVFALHTSELMHIALPMYLRLGFVWAASVPDIHGVKYGVYLKDLMRED
jgi:GNAT superfamily N-acetyltransferase